LERDNPFVFNNIPASDANYLCFHEHSRIDHSFPQRPFVFNNIPGSFVQKRILSACLPTVQGSFLPEDACQQIIFPGLAGFSSPGQAEARR
jgi:hypothetical protein